MNTEVIDINSYDDFIQAHNNRVAEEMYQKYKATCEKLANSIYKEYKSECAANHVEEDTMSWRDVLCDEAAWLGISAAMVECIKRNHAFTII